MPVMEQRILRWDGVGVPTVVDHIAPLPKAPAWVWVDLYAERDAPPAELDALVELLALDRLAAHDALHDLDLPKVDDFGHHLLIVMHGLADERIETYELDCFLTESVLLTVHKTPSPSVDSLWHGLQAHPELAVGGASEVTALLADGVTRRLLAVIEAFDERLDELTSEALVAASNLLADVSAVRSELAAVRRVVHPQREALDLLRSSSSALISNQARRRFADVFDVAARTASGLDAARTALAETLDAYRGAEARQATDVTKVLTVYAAVLLPITLVASFFGMNHRNLPTIDSSWGWIAVSVFMAVIAIASLGVFVAEGWVRRPSGRRAGASLGRGLVEAARTPVHLAEAVLEISTLPLRRALDSVFPGEARDRSDEPEGANNESKRGE